jgi:hypothetical protein
MRPEWFFPVFALMWLGVCGLLSVLGGWSGLASRFRAEQPVPGERLRFVSGSMGNRFYPVSYGSCLFVTVNDAGFGLSILFPFRFLTPPLFIPWNEVTSVEVKRPHFLPYCVIQLRDQWQTIKIRSGAGLRIAAVYTNTERSTQQPLVY